jgi:uncharacterized protein YcbK (DUF882 family)
MISRAEVLMGRDRDYPLTPDMEKNLEKLLLAVNKLRVIYGKPMRVSSGYRPGHYNKAAGGAKNSTHLTCQAVDFADSDRTLAQWCLNNITVLADSGLYLEDPAHTPGWVHLQTRPTKKRVFTP